jgi:hypothetical protein
MKQSRLTNLWPTLKTPTAHMPKARRMISQHILVGLLCIEVLGLHSCKSSALRAQALKRRLIAMCDMSTRERANMLTQFSCSHFLSLAKHMLGCFSNNTNDFQFAKATWARGFSTTLLESCLVDFLQQLPSQVWLWHVAAPIVASALLLSSYPPHAHSE